MKIIGRVLESKENAVIEISEKVRHENFNHAFFELLLQVDFIVAIADKLSPSIVKKLPKTEMSSIDKFFEIMHERVLAKVTSSHPDKLSQEFIKITYYILFFDCKFILRKNIFLKSKFLFDKSNVL